MFPHDAGHPESFGTPPPGRREPKPVAGRIEPSALPSPDTAPPPGLSAAPDLVALLRSLQRRWMLATALGIPLALVAAVAAWTLLTPRYTAFSQFKVSYDIPNLIFQEKGSGGNVFSTYLRTQAAQVKSRPVIAAALKRDDVRRLNLDTRYPDPAQWIEEELKVEFQEPSEILTLLLNGADPSEAVTLVKAITAAYMDEIVYAEQRGRVARVAELEKVYNETLESHKQKKTNLKRLAESLGTTSEAVLTQQQLEILKSLDQAKVQRNQFRTEVLKAEAAVAAHAAKGKGLPEVTITEAVVQKVLHDEPEHAKLLERAGALKKIIKDYQENAVNPYEITRVKAERALKTVMVQLNRRKGQLRAELKKRQQEQIQADHEAIRAEMDTNLGALNTLLAKFQSEVDDLTTKSSKIGISSSELEALRAEIKREERVLDDIGDRLDKLRLELRSPQRVTVYQDAELQKTDGKRRVMAASVSPMGVLFAVGLGVALLEHRRRRIRTASDVAGGLGIRVVGTVPPVPPPEQQLLIPAGDPGFEGHPALESIDAIRTLLLREAAAGVARVVLVTSATEGEGKTTLAGHLAGSLARAGRKTLLIDGDLRRPAVHQMFEVPMQPGFSEVLLGEVEAADAVQETPVDGLAIMTAGQWDREVLQALARDGLEGVFDKLREEFDFLVIDSHPVLPAADTLLLAQRVDTVILSVLREVSQAPRVYAASQRLAALGIRVLGAVVNGADPEEVVPATAYAAPAVA
jgi:capsular exopolysaccharide synthesis family protein